MIASKSNNSLNSTLLRDPEKSSKSELMKDIFYKILHLAKLESNVILVGEIGSGKKRLAQIIHENSSRADKPFYTFYCVDVDESAYKAAFWGHLQFEDNGMTLQYDALEKSYSGILYLDQFSELSERYMMNIIDSYQKGCNLLFRNNKLAQPRLIISLNQDSYQEIMQSQVGNKLLNELNPVVILLPPLRERKEDIPVLIDYFLKEIRKNSADYKDLKISQEALHDCCSYSWPGNIIQLKNAILHGAILSYGGTIQSQHLPFTMSWKLPYEMNNKPFRKHS